MSKPWTNTNFICARIVIGLFICALSSRPQAIANRPCGTKMAPKHRNVNFIKYLRMHQITPFPNSRNKIQKMSWGGHRHSGRGTPPPHTHPHLRRLDPRAYGTWRPPPPFENPGSATDCIVVLSVWRDIYVHVLIHCNVVTCREKLAFVCFCLCIWRLILQTVELWIVWLYYVALRCNGQVIKRLQSGQYDTVR